MLADTFERALRINLQGIHQTNIARLVTVPAPGFVAELAPIPVIQGDFDSSMEESEEWAASPDGQEAYKRLMGGK